MGTTGTLMGTGRYLKAQKPEVRIVGVEPTMGHAIQGLKNMTESMVPGIFRARRARRPAPDDRRGGLRHDEAAPARREGLFVGSSSGAAVAVALQLAAEIDHGTIVALLPDRGDRYLSTMQFRSICGKCPP